MHTKQTVKYICKQYSSGNCYYYKQEIITHDSWENIKSLTWSAPRPITKETFLKRKKEGFKTEFIVMEKKPAVVINFSDLVKRR
ncbi:hypothetical protein [Alkalihalobacterium elongatum]|uniref:hypothetical protein n=1 Tax=Alkalihalobacterium elongatum TaxID=2675466 RepID=UPI001C1FD486|nr:hypothetical protein [Alkalihalobacterium elongatum]